jgi:hypothetical protein
VDNTSLIRVRLIEYSNTGFRKGIYTGSMRWANEDDKNILENARKVAKLRICGGGRENGIVAVKGMGASKDNGYTIDVCLELKKVLVPLLREFRARRPHR